MIICFFLSGYHGSQIIHLHFFPETFLHMIIQSVIHGILGHPSAHILDQHRLLKLQQIRFEKHLDLMISIFRILHADLIQQFIQIDQGKRIAGLPDCSMPVVRTPGEIPSELIDPHIMIDREGPFKESIPFIMVFIVLHELSLHIEVAFPIFCRISSRLKQCFHITDLYRHGFLLPGSRSPGNRHIRIAMIIHPHRSPFLPFMLLQFGFSLHQFRKPI